MSLDVQYIRDTAAVTPLMVREHAVFLEAQRSDRRVHKARGIADQLQRNQKPAKGGLQGLVDDLKV
ncbi:MAG: hypothetical protein R3C46_00350 [Hyphomonadaceae bacterium]